MRRALLLFAGLALAGTSMACQGNVFELKTGDCYNGAASGTISDVKVVDCATAHDAEVFYTFQYPSAPSAYPGDDSVRQAAETGCMPAFTAFVGLPYENSIYELTYLRPTTESWDTGDRTLLCLIRPAAGTEKLTGSVKGSNK